MVKTDSCFSFYRSCRVNQFVGAGRINQEGAGEGQQGGLVGAFSSKVGQV